MSLIEVEDLEKIFYVAARREGRFGSLRTLFSREVRAIHAVDHVSFTIEQGEMVGYIGPNGAGKSTTMKMLTGILHPSSGRVVVAGRVPQRDRVAHVRQIGVVFGQRSQLWWDLPTVESFALLRFIYRIPRVEWQERLELFSEMLDLLPFLDTPVRQLSLGQRMRADLVAALLHNPSILFLDEPTIGLDVVARERIREFLEHINRTFGITVLLTTHDLADIERLCQRVVVIDHGHVVYDGALERLRTRFGRMRTLVVDLAQPVEAISVPKGDVVAVEGNRVSLRFDREQTSAAELIAAVAARYPIRDLMVREPEIEAVIQAVYTQHNVQGRGDKT